MSTLNPINFRFPFSVEDISDPITQQAVRYLTSGVVDLNQAIAYIKPILDSTASTANAAASSSSTASGVSSFNSETGAVVYFPQLGTVNDQLGESSYETQQSDNGAKIIVGDSSAVTVTLNNTVTAPWFTIIDNDSSTMVALSPGAGAGLFGTQVISPGCFGIVFFDGVNFWAGGTVIATDSSLGYVQPDNVTVLVNDSGIISVPIADSTLLGLVEPDNMTIGVDLGMIYTQIAVDSGPPGYTPSTLGNPFYFDSTASPWHGWVYWGNKWNQFS